MPLIVYGALYSPGVRATLITAKLLGVPYELKEVDLLKGEHLKPEYLKLNPLHKIPVIDDNGFILAESHAIVVYLVEKYGKDDALYPKDIKTHAIVNHRMYFDTTTLFPKLPESMRDIKTIGTISEITLAAVNKSLTQLEKLLGDEKWIAGTTNYTVADICLLGTLENFTASFPGKVEAREKLVGWLKRGRLSIKGYEEITRVAIQGLGQLFSLTENLGEILKFVGN